jgi:hypothetical protein
LSVRLRLGNQKDRQGPKHRTRADQVAEVAFVEQGSRDQREEEEETKLAAADPRDLRLGMRGVSMLFAMERKTSSCLGFEARRSREREKRYLDIVNLKDAECADEAKGRKEDQEPAEDVGPRAPATVGRYVSRGGGGIGRENDRHGVRRVRAIAAIDVTGLAM